jgi:Arc/MetJ family transcription regulator
MNLRLLHIVRTNIEIEDRLMRDALRVSGERTKRAVVDRALRLLVETHAQAGIRRLRGKVRWTGDLDARRRARTVAVE